MSTPTDMPAGPDYPADLVDRTLNMVSNLFLSTVRMEDGPFSPLTVHIFYPPLLFGMMSMFQETVLVNGALTRQDKEILASFVSNSNQCVFCTNAHQLFAKSQGADIDEVRMATKAGDPMALSNKRLGGIIKWMVAAQRKGAPELDQKPFFTKKEVPEIVGTAFKFNYINRIVDTFVTRQKLLPKRFPKHILFLYNALGFMQRRVDNSIVERVYGKNKTPPLPGSAVQMMDRFPELPEDFAWAESNEPIAKGFAYFAWAVDALAQVYIPVGVTDFVGKYVDENYDGSTPPLSRKWVFEVAENFDGTESERFAVAIMLLVSFARFQIDDALKVDFESHYRSFDTRRAMCMWASFRTARKIASWQGEALARHLKETGNKEE